MAPKIEPTICCALGILRAKNEDTEEDIKKILDQVGKEQEKNWYCTPPEKGQTLLFCVTIPTEEELVEKLKACGFTFVIHFPRRTGYPVGELTLWAYQVR